MPPATSTGGISREFGACLFSAVDPHGETRMGASKLQQLVAELEQVLAQAMAGAEHSGLMRLRAMAERAEEHGGLLFVGD